MNTELLEQAELFFQKQRNWLMNKIGEYVDFESPTSDQERVDIMAAHIEQDLEELGAWIDRPIHAPRPVYGRFGRHVDRERTRLTLVFHHDTVWPVGGFSNKGIRNECWYGPGIFDMKANIALMFLVLKYLRQYKPELLTRIQVVSSPDEEIMGPVSRRYLPKLVKDCEWALVFEPPLPNGGYKSQRKGVGKARVKFRGIPTHAGNHYFEGKSALRGAARLLLAAENLTNQATGLTVNAGLLSGGSAANTRPGHAELTFDVRVLSEQDWQAVLQFLKEYRDPEGVEIEIQTEDLLPPMNSAHEGWDRLRDVCECLGMVFRVGAAGGGSDGSNLSSLGIKVLDGLGVAGGGEHANDEHIHIPSLFATFRRNILLIDALLAEQPAQ